MGVIRKLLPFLLLGAGVALMAYGVSLVYEPAAVILAGLSLVVAGLVRDWEPGS